MWPFIAGFGVVGYGVTMATLGITEEDRRSPPSSTRARTTERRERGTEAPLREVRAHVGCRTRRRARSGAARRTSGVRSVDPSVRPSVHLGFVFRMVTGVF